MATYSSILNGWAATLQQKYQDISTTDSKDHYYLVAAVVSTAALASLSLYAPITFGCCSVILTGINAVQFGKTISEAQVGESDHLKTWMIVTCLVTSSVLGALAIHSLPLFASGMQSLLAFELPWAVFCFTIATGTLGFGLPAVKALYERGLELFKTEKWEAMENYLSHKPGSSDFIDRMVLVMIIAMPELCQTSLFRVYLLQGFYFLPEKMQGEIFATFLKVVESLEDNREKKAGCERVLKPCFLSLSESLKTQYYPSLVKLHEIFSTQEFKQQIPSGCVEQYEQKHQEIRELHSTLFDEIQQALEKMAQDMNNILESEKGKPLFGVNAECLTNLNKQLVLLRERLSGFISDCKLYCPELPLSPREEGDKQCYTALNIDLLRGEVQQKLQKLTSLQASATQEDDEGLDLEEGIGNYILMHYTNENRNGGLVLFGQVAERFGVGAQDLDGLEEALKPLGIETVGKFIEVVFSGNKEGFDNAQVVLEKLDAYLQARKESEESLRGRIYTVLAGSTLSEAVKTVGSHSTQILNTANKVTYKAVMILSTIAPITFQPTVFAVTFAGTVVWNLTYAVAGHLIPQSVKSGWNVIRQVRQIRGIEFAIRTASRRPFLNLFSSLNYIDYEMHTYLAADFFGKMRLLSAELFYGVIVSYAAISNGVQAVEIGGFVAGVAVGNEATQLIQRAWKKLAA